ncbi:MAG: hypothetical protein Q8P22_07365 [Chloroflexota bacterium]|nr:hypothetical protein [Chloroflexota bacterium]
MKLKEFIAGVAQDFSHCLGDPMNWEFESGDVNRDGYLDLIGVLEKGPIGTGRREVHVLNGATNFTTFLLQTGTAVGLDQPHNWDCTALRWIDRRLVRANRPKVFRRTVQASDPLRSAQTAAK